MPVKITVFLLAILISFAMPVQATQTAVIPAYALVSAIQSSIVEYRNFMNSQNRAAARKLLDAEKVFLSPRDIRVEVVAVEADIVKVKLNRLDKNAEPVSLYFWTLAEQLKMLPRE